jgi:hypothetical protein
MTEIEVLEDADLSPAGAVAPVDLRRLHFESGGNGAAKIGRSSLDVRLDSV